MVNKKLIKKFFENRCNAQEAEAVVDHFTRHPEELEQYLPEKEWEQFSNRINVTGRVSEKMWKHIRKEIHKRSAGQKYLVLSIAASVLICFFIFGKIYLDARKDGTPEVAKTTKAPSIAHNTDDLIKKVNDKNKTLVVNFDEGSVAELSPGSEIRYPRSFKNKENRQLYLKGEAFFKVAKDTARPFTVFAAGLSTTALGTSFTIQATTGNKKVKVKLHTGRVVVRAVSGELKNKMDDVYLSPGQELQLDPINLTTLVVDFLGPAKAEKVGSVTVSGDMVEFDGLPLSGVFEKLSDIYNIKIMYYHADFSKTYFTGKINKTDSIENILNTLAILNDLKILKDQDGYIIKNNQQ